MPVGTPRFFPPFFGEKRSKISPVRRPVCGSLFSGKISREIAGEISAKILSAVSVSVLSVVSVVHWVIVGGGSESWNGEAMTKAGVNGKPDILFLTSSLRGFSRGTLKLNSNSQSIRSRRVAPHL